MLRWSESLTATQQPDPSSNATSAVWQPTSSDIDELKTASKRLVLSNQSVGKSIIFCVRSNASRCTSSTRTARTLQHGQHVLHELYSADICALARAARLLLVRQTQSARLSHHQEQARSALSRLRNGRTLRHHVQRGHHAVLTPSLCILSSLQHLHVVITLLFITPLTLETDV